MFKIKNYFLITLCFVFGLFLIASLPSKTEASGLHISGTPFYVDETSAVKIFDKDNLDRKFAINVYELDSNGNPADTTTIWFFFSHHNFDNIPRGMACEEFDIQFSFDDKNWETTHAYMNPKKNNPVGKIFLVAWRYALGYPLT